MQTTSLKGAHLSLQQRRLWSLQQESQAYRAQCAIKVQGRLNVAVLLQVLLDIAKQHEILHTTFSSVSGMDVPMQIIGNPSKLSCSTLDMEGLCDADQTTQLQACFHLLQERPHDLAQGPALSLALVRMGSRTHMLLLGLPALCADSATLKHLVAEIQQAYSSRQRGKRLFAAEPLQYVDVSAWQNDLLELEDTREQQEFWHKIALSPLNTLLIPFERKEDEVYRRLGVHGSFAPQRLAQPMDEALQRQILAFCQGNGVSPEVFLLACWQLLLWRLGNGSSYPLGVSCDGRYYEELAHAIGCYTRVVPFTIPLTENLPFAHLLSLVAASLNETLQRQMSFTWKQLDIQESELGFFPVSFEFVSWPASLADENLTFTLQQHYCCTEQFSLKLSVLQVGESLRVDLYFDPMRLSTTHAGYLIDLLYTLLDSASSQPDVAIGALQILNRVEQQRLQNTFKGDQKAIAFQMLQTSFEAQVARRPMQVAVVCDREALTYQELNKRANQLAHFLRRKGVGPGILVGLCVERSVHMLVGLLAILKAGGAYVPLDPEQPVTRQAYQLRDLAGSPLLLTQERFLPRFEEWEGLTFCLDRDQGLLAQESASNPANLNTLQDLAYVIYTSGSTGLPKGVMISYGAVSNYVQSLCALLAPEPGLQFATVSTLSADLGNTAIFCALASGGSLHVLSYETATSGRAFASYLRQHPIDVLKIVPSHLSALLNSGVGKDLLPRRHLVLGGEALSWRFLASLQELGADCSVINHYGPTETTIGALVNILGPLHEDRGAVRDEGVVPIGRPIANMEAYILDKNLHVVPVGVIGELCLAGAGLATGYLHQPEQTTERFIAHPFNEGAARMYRTGDMARYREDGLIEFVGRRDNQVKIRGFRIELAEVEAALNGHANVRESVVVLKEERSGEPQLVAYVVAQQPVTVGDLHKFLENLLPRHMLPARFVFLRALPLTTNGKVNRPLLSHPHGQEEQALLSLVEKSELRIPVQPRDEIEFQLLHIWETLLDVSPISILDNFFDIGGHSILAVRLVSLIHKQFGQEVALATLFNAPTIEGLALLLRQHTPQLVDESILVKLAGGSNTPFFCVHPAGSYAFCYTELARYLGPDQPFYGLQTPLTREHYGSLEDMATSYIEAIQAVQPQGPYLLGGWSLGGVVALEMAQQLRSQGQEVALLSIMDSDAPLLQNAQASLAAPDIDDAALAKDVLSAFELPALGEDLQALEPEMQLEYACEQAKAAHIFPADVELNLLRRIMVMRKMNIYAVRRYEPQVYAGKITLFRATASIRGAQDTDITRGWEKLTTEAVEVHLIAGRHRQLVEVPAVQSLAVALKQCIAERLPSFPGEVQNASARKNGQR